MKKIVILIIGLLITHAVVAQITVDAKIDSVAILIGQQARMTVGVTGSKGISVVFPEFKPSQHIISGVEVLGSSVVDTTDLDNIRKAIRPSTKGIFIETPSNPLLDVTDIRGTVAIAKEYGLLTIVDNTFLSPYLQRPLELGADIVVHSATKYLSGHNDIIAGAVVVNDDTLAEKISFAQVAIGALISPFDSWLLIRSIKTLKVRMDYAQANTLKLIDFLQGHPAVERVYYPTLSSNKGKAIQESQASGAGAVFSFVMKDEKKVKTFFEALRVALFAVSLGGVETLVTHPSTHTHTEFPEEEKVARGVTQTLVRVAVGLENIEDLIADFKQALEK